MKSRLAALGVAGVGARTFHSAALAQLHHFAPGVGRADPADEGAAPPPDREHAAAAVQVPAGRRSRDRDRVGEGAADRRRTEYRRSLGEHEPPIPADLMATVYREYERRKAARGEIDFEDLLELAIRLHETDEQVRADVPRALPRVHRRRVPGRQPAPADAARPVARRPRRPLRRRRRLPVDLRVHGRLAALAARGRGAVPACDGRAARGNYRSTPEVLELANRLVPRLGGAEKVLRPTRGSGPGAGHSGASRRREAEDAWIAGEVEAARARRATPLEEMAVLARTNARLADFEEAFHDAGIPFQGSSLLERDAARRMLQLLERDGSTGVAARVRALAEEAGLLYSLPDKLGERELTRQADLARLVRLAAELDDGGADAVAGSWLSCAAASIPAAESARGVHLLTYHRAKGLEFDAVFLPRLDEKELPSKLAARRGPAEERRLLLRRDHAGAARARDHVVANGRARSSPSSAWRRGPSLRRREKREALVAADPELYDALAAWRKQRAKAEEIPAYIVFHNTVLAAIADAQPRSLLGARAVAGVGPSKLERYGEDVLGVVAAA